MPDTTNSKNEQEFKTFGFTGKLRTGFVTAVISLLFSAVVFLYQENRRKDDIIQILNDDKLEIQQDLYERMLPQMQQRIDKKVDEKVQPMINRADTTMTNIDNLIQDIKK